MWSFQNIDCVGGFNLDLLCTQTLIIIKQLGKGLCGYSIVPVLFCPTTKVSYISQWVYKRGQCGCCGGFCWITGNCSSIVQEHNLCPCKEFAPERCCVLGCKERLVSSWCQNMWAELSSRKSHSSLTVKTASRFTGRKTAKLLHSLKSQLKQQHFCAYLDLSSGCEVLKPNHQIRMNNNNRWQ